MKIGEFRAAVDSLNWNRCDLSGATRQEFVAMDVRARLERHIVIVTGMVPLVHARFGDDLGHAVGHRVGAGHHRPLGRLPGRGPDLTQPGGALSSGRCPEGAGQSPGGRHRGRCAPGMGRVAQAGTTRAWSPTRCTRVAHARDTPSALALTPRGRPSALRSASILRCAG